MYSIHTVELKENRERVKAANKKYMKTKCSKTIKYINVLIKDMLRNVVSFPRLYLRSFRQHSSGCCGGNHEQSEAEKNMTQLLQKSIEGCTNVEVHDVSNGCGSMFDVVVEASSFKGKSKVAQHKIVTGVLREQIKDMHGLTIKTKSA